MASHRGDEAWQEWVREYGQNPIWLGKDWRALAMLEKELGPRFLPTWKAYLRCRERYYWGHPPSKLLGDVNRFLSSPEPAPGDVDEYGEVDPRAERVVKQMERVEAEAKRREAEHRERVRQAILENRPLSREEAKTALKTMREALEQKNRR